MKVISTVGPSIKSNKQLKNLIELGCDGFRFNTSHMDKKETDSQMRFIKSLNRDNVKIIQDLQGHKIRVSNLVENNIELIDSSEKIVCTEEYYKNFQGDKNKLIPIDIEFSFNLLRDIGELSVKNGTVKFKVIDNSNEDCLICKILGNGSIRPKNGITAKGLNRFEMGISNRDKEAVLFGLDRHVDIIYLSYVVNHKDVREMKGYIKSIVKANKGYKMPLIYSKIESMEGIENFKNILKESDGIVLGRGDLYTEIDMLEYPLIQNKIIQQMKKSKKELVLATNILGTLAFRKVPTISEVCDLYNLIKNKVNTIVLVSETSVGKYPRNALKFTKEFIEKTLKEV